MATTKKTPKKSPRRKPSTAPRPAAKTGEGRKAPRTDKWPRPWLALFERVGGKPRAFAEEIGVAYQTIWRIAIGGAPAGFEVRHKVRTFAANHDVPSPL